MPKKTVRGITKSLNGTDYTRITKVVRMGGEIRMKYYLLQILADVWPTIRGPYESPLTRDRAALRIKAETGNEDDIYKLDCPSSNNTKGMKPVVSAYDSEFMGRVTRKDL